MLVELFEQFRLLTNKMDRRENPSGSGGKPAQQHLHDSGIANHMATVS